MTGKYCVDCKHIGMEGSFFLKRHVCRKFPLNVHSDPVFGERVQYNDCRTCRKRDWLCGVDGKCFEPKESKPQLECKL